MPESKTKTEKPTAEDRLRARNLDLERERDRLKTALSNSVNEVERLRKFMDRYASVKARDMRIPAWMKAKPSGTKHHATPVLCLSDLHLDEVVEAAEMDGVNEYNREIAEQRLHEVIESTIKLVRDYIGGVEIDGIVVAMLGDLITGDIHEELAKTNEAPVPASIVHWVPLLAAALKRLADEFGAVFVPCVDGNHDRTQKQTPKKKRAESSFAWIIYNWLADTLADDDRITFSITPAAEQIVTVYETAFLLSHGDSFRSSGGVGGLYPSLLKWLLRRKDYYSMTGNRFDIALIGHWHQYLTGKDFIVNGSLKGYDEYARDGGFGFERPQQALFIVTPERGVVQQMPVHAN